MTGQVSSTTSSPCAVTQLIAAKAGWLRSRFGTTVLMISSCTSPIGSFPRSISFGFLLGNLMDANSRVWVIANSRVRMIEGFCVTLFELDLLLYSIYILLLNL